MKNRVLLLVGSVISVFSIAYGQCSSYPVLELGNDTTLCNGATLLLQPSGYDSYTWSTGAVTNNITVSAPGTYFVEVTNVSGNLVTNGDFEQGNVSFSSGYTYGSGGAWGLLSNEGQYAIATSPSLTHSNFSFCNDHTPSGPGNMLVANGSGVPNSSVWCQTINVTPNTDYLFSAWFTNALNDPNVSNLQFFVNNVQVGPVFSTTANACSWAEFNEVWNSGAAITADLCIRNQNTSIGGNDFAIDDITFREVCVQNDTITVTYDPLSVSIASDLLFCENETETFQASSTVPNTTLIWETGDIGGSYTPTTSGTYTVHAISANGCYVADSAVATITPMPWGIDTVIVGPTSCGTDNGYVSLLTNGTFNVPPMYTWNGPGAANPNQINASVWTDLGMGWYYLSVESDGCFLYDSAQITPLDPPVATISASIVSGCEPLVVTFTNTSINATSYIWDFDNGQTVTVPDLSNQTQTFTDANTGGGLAVVQMIASQGDCADTASVSITISICGCTDPTALNFNPLANADDNSCVYPIPPTPTVEVYNVFTPDGDEDNPTYFIKTTNSEKVQLTILNRWGNPVFDETSPNPVWDGKINGVNADEGVYFYTYVVTGINGETLEGHGFLQLLRK
ncbi:MAG: gliding motility-associated C-terminal domain-containing protein [Fluviicola sp.]|nr:gliding motility-associated C-terminal domain-containing protein [Fluviicola sp.]